MQSSTKEYLDLTRRLIYRDLLMQTGLEMLITIDLRVIIFLNLFGGPISWMSKRVVVVSLSTIS
jgi:hypothetical protein